MILREGVEGALPLPKVYKVRHGESERRLPNPCGRLVQNDKAFRSLVRQRMHEHAVHDREDGGVRANAEREGQEDDRSKAEISRQSAQSISQILAKMFEETEETV